MVETKILLTTTTKWPNAPRLLIELLRAGHAVSIVCCDDHPSEKIRGAHDTFLYSCFRPLRSLAKAIEATQPDLIIPCDDLSVLHLHRLYASEQARSASRVDIPGLIVRSLGAPESYPIVDSRHLLLNVAREEGIRVPETIPLSDVKGLAEQLAHSPYPWVLKSGGSSGGNGVRMAATLAEAQTYFTELRRSPGLLRFIKRITIDKDAFAPARWWDVIRYGPDIVAQQFVAGRPANCAVLCSEGEILAGIGCEDVSDQPSLAPANVVRLVDHPDMMDAAAKIARRLRLSGFFGLDFIFEEGTGSAFLIEMNPRCTQHCHLRLGEGRDMIGALTARLKGTQSLPLSSPITQNNLIAYFPRALIMGSHLLPSCYHDAPLNEPELVGELLLEELNFLRSERVKEKRRPAKTKALIAPLPTQAALQHMQVASHDAKSAPQAEARFNDRSIENGA